VQSTAVGGVTAALLDNPVRTYAWGSTTAIPELLGVPPTGAPQAELWMGAHPADPSRVHRGDADVSLLACIDAAPERELGAGVVARFGPRLPYLLKVIAAAAPLSLQAHPDPAQAAEGYARENAEGVPLTAPERNYKDPSHKPELVCPLTPFDALCGFRAIPDTLRLLDELTAVSRAAEPGSAAGRAAAALAPCAGALRARPDEHGLREVVTGLITMPAEKRTGVVEAVAAACAEATGAGAGLNGEFAAEFRTVTELAAGYPADVGVVIALLMNLVHLRPGQAVYLPAGRLHAYLRGTAVEIMANSDNVLRGGLTPKHVDVAELMRVLDLSAGPVSSPVPRRVGIAEEVYDTPASEFRLSRLQVPAGDGGEPLTLAPAGPQILLVADGTLVVCGAGDPVRVARGHAAWVPAGATVMLTGPATAYRATTNLG
jgi:mannose-6-phosphate isomerase